MLIYGLHAVEAALKNPRRQVRRLLATPNALARLEPALAGRGSVETVTPRDLDRLLGEDAVHQGAAMEAEPLPPVALEDVRDASLIVVLDQVTDPHNVGAILRSAAAFGAGALVMTEHHSPPLSGVLAKAASGGLEVVPIVMVPNLARAMAKLGDLGFERLGLDSAGDVSLGAVLSGGQTALVLGAEDKGLRRLTRENCDRLCRIETADPLRSLNVSNAAAIALSLAFTAGRRPHP